MILSALAAIVAMLAPPLDMPIRYHIVDRTPGPNGETRVDTDMTLRFRRKDGVLVAGGRTDAITVTAPPAIKARVSALMRPLVGSTTQAEIAPDGAVGALVDSEASWQAFRASQQALLASIEATPGAKPEMLALARRSIATMLDPAARDQHLRPGLAQLLPPPVPPIDPGAGRTVRATIATPGSARHADNDIRLVAASATRLDYHIETIADAGDDAPGGGVFAQISDVVIERGTGLLASIVSRRELRRAGRAAIVMNVHEVRRAP